MFYLREYSEADLKSTVNYWVKLYNPKLEVLSVQCTKEEEPIFKIKLADLRTLRAETLIIGPSLTLIHPH
nr:MAG TPA: hypothetical protein [Caudoviricetes sp.]